MLWLEKKYVLFCQGYLDKFKAKGNDVWNFRCPFCGDSQISSRKARGYIFRDKDRLHFKCHNCFEDYPFPQFLQLISPPLFKDYLVEKYRPTKKKIDVVEDASKEQAMKLLNLFSAPSFKKFCTPVTSLDKNHTVNEYLDSRSIPDKTHFWYCENFKQFEQLLPHYKDRLFSGPRLILPVYNRQKEIVAFVCRSLRETDKLRYINLVVDPNQDRFIFGIDRVDLTKRVNVVEGPIDSLFLPNCIGIGTADFSSIKGILSKDSTTLIYDNQPLNRELIKNIYKMANFGWSICIWPKWIKQKDINDMVKAGMDPAYIMQIIDEHTYSGLKLKLKITEWTTR